MNGYYYTWNSINAGVPQGSILGPLLFLLFINDIVDVLSNSMKLFADDTSLYCIVDDQNETAESLNSDLNSLSTWASDWCVNFNASKTKTMLFTRKHDVNIPPLYMTDDQQLHSDHQQYNKGMYRQQIVSCYWKRHQQYH
jgi:hypothetical protein